MGGKRKDTWINETIVALYGALFAQGHAHSVEGLGESLPPPGGG
ncbi:MAG: hypothetical protein WDN72_00645 [Alphaproteobacteria bacterium]